MVDSRQRRRAKSEYRRPDITRDLEVLGGPPRKPNLERQGSLSSDSGYKNDPNEYEEVTAEEAKRGRMRSSRASRDEAAAGNHARSRY